MKENNWEILTNTKDSENFTVVYTSANQRLKDEDISIYTKYEILQKVVDELVKENKKLKDGIIWWIEDRMKNYSDSQYGKKEMKDLIT